jgi:hypothetical protein
LHWRLGLPRRSRIARIIFRQIGIISTHRKIGHLSYIISYTGAKGSHLANKKTKYRVQQKSKGTTEGTSGLAHRTVRCTRGLQLKLVTFGKIQRRLRYNSPDCPVYAGQCPVLQGRAALELASFGNPQLLVRYNSPDMFGVHRTVRCDNEATDTSAPTATCSALNARQRAQKSDTPMLAHRTLYSTCPVRHRTSRRAQKTDLQRSEPNGFGDVAGAPDCLVHHTTVSPTKRLVWWLGL